MKTTGIRISDENNILNITLSDILEEVSNSDSLHWDILFLDGMPNPGNPGLIDECEQKINQSKNGLLVSIAELNLVSNKFFQIYETTILGCMDERFLVRYSKEEEMYNTCDIVIELIDCSFWEVYSKDHNLVDKLIKKFKKSEVLK